MTYYWTVVNLDRYHYFDSYEKLLTVKQASSCHMS